jgi:hypothetical protein
VDWLAVVKMLPWLPTRAHDNRAKRTYFFLDSSPIGDERPEYEAETKQPKTKEKKTLIPSRDKTQSASR